MWNPKVAIKILLGKDFKNLQDTKSAYKNEQHFIYQLKNILRKKSGKQLCNNYKNTRYLGATLTMGMKDCYNENHETLVKKI